MSTSHVIPEGTAVKTKVAPGPSAKPIGRFTSNAYDLVIERAPTGSGSSRGRCREEVWTVRIG